MANMKKLTIILFTPPNNILREGVVYINSDLVKRVQTSAIDGMGSDIWFEDDFISVKESPEEVLNILSLEY